MKNNHIRILMGAFAACCLLLAVACGKEEYKTKGNLEPTAKCFVGSSWTFDSLSGDFAYSHLSFDKDSMRFSAFNTYGWQLNGSTIEGRRLMQPNWDESVRMLIKELNVKTSTDAEGNQVKETTMVAEGYFARTYISNVDTFWTFHGTLKKR